MTAKSSSTTPTARPNFGLLQTGLRRQRQGRDRLFPVRRALSRRLRPAQCRPGRPPRPARRGAEAGQGLGHGALLGCIRHRSRRTGGGRLQDRPGRRDRQAPRFALRLAPLARLDQAEMRAAPGIRDRRLHRSQGRAHRHRRAAARAPTTRTACCAMPAMSAAASMPRACATSPPDSRRSRTDASPFPPRSVPGRKHHWVKPELIAEVSFSEWTSAGAVRHPVFQGLRTDKPAARHHARTPDTRGGHRHERGSRSRSDRTDAM